MATEEQIKLAARLYKCRDTAKSFLGIKYSEKMAVYQKYIKAAMVKHNTDDEITATMKMAKDVDADGMTVMLLMAACVEMIEPSKAS